MKNALRWPPILSQLPGREYSEGREIFRTLRYPVDLREQLSTISGTRTPEIVVWISLSGVA